MVSMTARQSLEEELRWFADGLITTSDLEKRLYKYDDSTDEDVNDIAFTYSIMCEDSPSPAIAVDKKEWNHLQRCLLYLRSDFDSTAGADLTPPVFVWRWHWSNAASILCLAVAVALFFIVPPPHAYVLGLIPAMAAFWASWPRLKRDWREAERRSVEIESVYPFDSAGQLIRFRKKTPGFAKIKYPEEVERRRRRYYGSLDERVITVLLVAMLVAIWPAALIFFCFPERVNTKFL